MSTKTKLIGAAVSVAALSAVGIGVAVADPQPAPTTPTSSASPSAGSSTKASTKEAKKADRKKHQRNLSKRALHGEATLGGIKKQHTIDFQRGTITAVSAGTVSVKSIDGFTASYQTDAKTKVHKAKAKATVGDLKVNDRVRVVALKDGSKLTLRAIGDQGPKK